MFPSILTNMSLCDLQTWDSNTGSSTQGLFACEVSLQTLHCRSLEQALLGYSPNNMKNMMKFCSSFHQTQNFLTFAKC